MKADKIKSGFPRIVSVILFNIIITFVLLEAGLRIAAHFNRGSRRLVYQRTAYTPRDIQACKTLEELLDLNPWWYEPYASTCGFVLNSRGFRTPEYNFKKDPGTRRIVVLGDSFIVDAGNVRNEDHIITRLGKEMAGKRRTGIINLGLSCSGPHVQSRLFELEGALLEPDDIVVAFFVGNDLTDEPEHIYTGTPFQNLTEQSAIFRFARNAWKAHEVYSLLPEIVQPPSPAKSSRKGGYYRGYPVPYPPPPPFSLKSRSRIAIDCGRIFFATWPGDIEDNWIGIAAVLNRIHAVSGRMGIRFLIVLIPDETQIEPELQRVVGAAYPDQELDFSRPQRIITAFCRKAGIPFLDLLPEFQRSHLAGDVLYMPMDTHWNPTGQRIAAKLIAAELKAAIPSKNRKAKR